MVIFYELLLLFLIIVTGLLYFVDIVSWEFRRALIIETFGSGVLATIVTAFFYQIQKNNNKRDGEKLALIFFEKLKFDIAEVKQRGDTLWNLSGNNKFYFDGSKINSLFDVVNNNIDQIINYLNYFSNDGLMKKIKDFYLLVRNGYVCGEKVDTKLYQLVRSENYKKGLISANDPRAIMYIKGRMFSSLDDQSLCKYLEWPSVLESVTKIYNMAIIDDSLKSYQDEIKEIRNKLEISCEKIIEGV